MKPLYQFNKPLKIGITVVAAIALAALVACAVFAMVSDEGRIGHRGYHDQMLQGDGYQNGYHQRQGYQGQYAQSQMGMTGASSMPQNRYQHQGIMGATSMPQAMDMHQGMHQGLAGGQTMGFRMQDQAAQCALHQSRMMSSNGMGQMQTYGDLDHQTMMDTYTVEDSFKSSDDDN